MFSHPATIGAPFGFVLGLLVSYGLADAGPGPVPPRILQDSLVLRMSIGSDIRDLVDERFTSFDERFAGEARAKKGSVTETSYRLASLEMPVGVKALVNAGSVLAPVGRGSRCSTPAAASPNIPAGRRAAHYQLGNRLWTCAVRSPFTDLRPIFRLRMIHLTARAADVRMCSPGVFDAMYVMHTGGYADRRSAQLSLK
jgi:hypothetical protein